MCVRVGLPFSLDGFSGACVSLFACFVLQATLSLVILAISSQGCSVCSCTAEGNTGCDEMEINDPQFRMNTVLLNQLCC